MAVLYDTSTSATSASSNTLAPTLTVASNSNRALVALLFRKDDASFVTSVKDGVTDFTLLGQTIDGSDVPGFNLSCEIWYLPNPGTGLRVITALWPDAAHCYIYVYSLYNVDQTTPLSGFVGDFRQNNSTNTNPVVSYSGGMVLTGCLNYGAETISEAGGQTPRQSTGADSKSSTADGASSVTVGYTFSGSNTADSIMTGCSVNPDDLKIRAVTTQIATTLVRSGTNVSSIVGTTFLKSSVTTNAATYNTASITPAAGLLYLAAIFNSKASAPDTPTINGNGGTWVQVLTNNYGSLHRMSIFRYRQTSPTTGTITIGFPATETGCGWNVSEFKNTWDGGSDNGSSAIVDFITGVGTNVTSGTLSLAAFSTMAGRNGIYAAWGIGNNQDIAAENGYTRIGTHGYNTPPTALMVAWKSVGGDINPSASWSTGGPFGGVALQLKSRYQSTTRAVSVGKAILAVVARAIITGGNTVRTIAMAIAPTATVSRLRRLVRNISVGKQVAFVVSRLRRLTRTLSVALPVLPTVSRLRRLVRKVALSTQILAVVSRLKWLKRTIPVSLPVKAIVSRLSRLLRNVTASLPIKATVSRLRWLIRRIAFANPVSLSLNRRIIRFRSAIVALPVKTVVRRVAWYIRRINLQLPISLSVSRLRRLIRTIRLTVVSSFSVSAIRAIKRTLATLVTPSLSVSRLARRVRTLFTQGNLRLSVSRVGWYKRTINRLANIKAVVSQSKISGIVVRSVSLAIQSVSRVSRRVWYRRFVVAGLPSGIRVSRIRWLTRSLQTRLGVKAVVSRLRLLVRFVSTVSPIRVVVGRSQRFVRFIRVALPVVARVSRIGRYIRRVATSTGVKSSVSWIIGTGEAILLRVLTLSKEALKYLSGSGKLTTYASTVGEKTSYSSQGSQQTTFSSSSQEKEKYRN